MNSPLNSAFARTGAFEPFEVFEALNSGIVPTALKLKIFAYLRLG